jgi:hypothetical protein
MDRHHGRFFPTIVAIVVGSHGCSKAMNSPTGPTAPSGPKFTFSGVVTDYHGGPLVGVSVGTSETDHTQTDQQGRYTLSTAYTRELDVWTAGHLTARKYNLPSQDSTLNFVLHPSVQLAFGASLTGTIWGDQFMAGDDVLNGGLCAHTAFQPVQLPDNNPASDQVEVHLRWSDPTRQLALYVSREGDFEGLPVPPPAKPADRYCCASELVAVFQAVNGFWADEPDIAVGFEQAGGRVPGPGDSQAFELMVRRLPAP